MSAETRMAGAQSLLDQIGADTAKIDDFRGWLKESADTVGAFEAYYHGKWGADREDAAARDFEAAGEDLPYEAIVNHRLALERLARILVNLITDDAEAIESGGTADDDDGGGRMDGDGTGR